jgi:hypothetical protein
MTSDPEPKFRTCEDSQIRHFYFSAKGKVMDLSKLDPAERIALYGQAVCVVLGNVEKRDYELVDVNAVPLPAELIADYHARGLAHCATFGIKDGKFVTAWETVPEDSVVTALAGAFVEFAIRKLTAPKRDTGAEWLQALWNLKDDRERSQVN